MKIELYNGQIEAAARMLIILEEFRPEALTVEELRLLDLFVLFGKDMGASYNLHPATGGRFNAYGWREAIIRNAIDILRELHLVKPSDETGDVFMSTGRPEVVQHIGACPYLARMTANARFIAGRVAELGRDEVFDGLKCRLNEVLREEMDMPATGRERFEQLHLSYESDIVRMEGLNEAAVLFGNAAALFRMDSRRFDDTADAAMKERSMVRSKLKELGEFLKTADEATDEDEGTGLEEPEAPNPGVAISS